MISLIAVLPILFASTFASPQAGSTKFSANIPASFYIKEIRTLTGFYRKEHEVEYTSAMSSEDAFSSLEEEASKLSHDLNVEGSIGGPLKLLSFDIKADYKFHQSVSRFSKFTKSGKYQKSESFKQKEVIIFEVPHGQTFVFYQKCMKLFGIETCNEVSSLPIKEFDERVRNLKAQTELEIDFYCQRDAGGRKSVYCPATGNYISMISTRDAVLNTDGLYGGGEWLIITPVIGHEDKVTISNDGYYLGVDFLGHVVKQTCPYYWKLMKHGDGTFSFQNRQRKYLSTTSRKGNPLVLMGSPLGDERFVINSV